MHEPQHTIFINQHLGWHAPKFEQVHFLTVKFQYPMFGIGQTDKWQLFLLPVISEGNRFFRTNHQYFRFQILKRFKILTQLRHVPAAKRSHKAAIKNHYHISAVEKI